MALRKIVFTGAPSSGKSSVLEALKQKFPKFAFVPETAAVLLGGGYPAPEIGNISQQRVFQRTIIQLQKDLEEMIALKLPNAPFMILDRALLDGVAYWPKGPSDYLQEFKIDASEEIGKYDHVIYFAIAPESQFGGMHEKRFHNYEQSREIGKKQHEVWKPHPSFLEIPAYEKFGDKVDHALRAVSKIVGL
jgi:hypothetical protein